MDAKKYLLQLRKLEKMISNKMDEKKKWLEIAKNITPRTGGERVQSSGSKQKMEDAICKYYDMEKEIDACIDELVDTRREIISLIEQLSPSKYDVLHKRYVQYLTYKEIGNSCGKTEGWATTVHGRALQDVQRILDERERHGCI